MKRKLLIKVVLTLSSLSVFSSHANRFKLLFIISLLIVGGELYALPPGPFVIKEEMTINTFYPIDGNVNYAVKPTPVDLDNDGDFDFIVGYFLGGFGYYENIGSSTLPSFVQRIGEGNPFRAITTSPLAYPEVIDLDGDGDFDLTIGVKPGIFRYFENIGSPTSADFVEHTGSENPLINIELIYIDEYAIDGNSVSPLALDADNDGDLDMIVTAGYPAWKIIYFENIGNRTTPEFLDRSHAIGPTEGMFRHLTIEELSLNMHATALDLDADGDFDLVLGNTYPNLAYLENQGTKDEPVFILTEDKDNPFYGLNVSTSNMPASWDMDSDGDQDLIVSNGQGKILFFENKNLKDYERTYNWAESVFSDLFPLPAEVLDVPPFKVHFYPKTGTYLGYNVDDENVYWYLPPYDQIELLAPLELYLEAVHAEGF